MGAKARFPHTRSPGMRRLRESHAKSANVLVGKGWEVRRKFGCGTKDGWKKARLVYKRGNPACKHTRGDSENSGSLRQSQLELQSPVLNVSQRYRKLLKLCSVSFGLYFLALSLRFSPTPPLRTFSEVFKNGTKTGIRSPMFDKNLVENWASFSESCGRNGSRRS